MFMFIVICIIIILLQLYFNTLVSFVIVHTLFCALKNHCSGKGPSGFPRLPKGSTAYKALRAPILESLQWVPSFSPIYRWENWSLDRSTHLSKGTQWMNDEAPIWPWHLLQPVPNPSPTCFPYNLVLGDENTDMALTWPLHPRRAQSNGKTDPFVPLTQVRKPFSLQAVYSRCPGLIPLQGMGYQEWAKVGIGWTQGLN